jgi:hypothetical protein
MKAFFADIKETVLVPTRGANAWGTKLSLPSDEQNRRLKELDQLLKQARSELEEKTQSLAARQPEWEKQITNSDTRRRRNRSASLISTPPCFICWESTTCVKFQGLDARLTGIAGYVVKEILA